MLGWQCPMRSVCLRNICRWSRNTCIAGAWNQQWQRCLLQMRQCCHDLNLSHECISCMYVYKYIYILDIFIYIYICIYKYLSIVCTFVYTNFFPTCIVCNISLSLDTCQAITRCIQSHKSKPAAEEVRAYLVTFTTEGIAYFTVTWCHLEVIRCVCL